MAAGPLVSVVIPTYDRNGLLARSIASVLAQTERQIEVIVVDDASPTSALAVVEAAADPRVRCIRLAANSGPAAARNRGVTEACAPLIAFQDSDDEWLPRKLELQLAALHPRAGVATCDMIRVRASGARAYHRSPDVEPGRLLNRATGFYQTFALGTQTALVRRDLFERVGGFDESLRYCEDSELFLRLAAHAPFVRVPEPLVLYHETGGLVTDHRAEVRARRRMLAKHLAALWRESPAFVVREAMLLAARTLGGSLTAGWRGRPYGPPEPEAHLRIP